MHAEDAVTIAEYLTCSRDVIQAAIDDAAFSSAISEIVDALAAALASGGKLLLAGNGGSAADAQHFAGELVGKFMKERKAFAALALTVDTSVLTSWSNDVGFDTVFARQVEALGKPSDVLIVISTSGNSKNLIEAAKQAKTMGLRRIIGLLGNAGGALKDLCDVAVIVPSKRTPAIQQVHEIVFHAICEEVERDLS